MTGKDSAVAEQTSVAGKDGAAAEKTSAGGAVAEKLDAVTAGGVGMRHIAGLTTKEAEGITSVEPADDGWLVNVEVIEDRRIPSSGDILAVYQAQIDQEGRLLSYRRVRRYRRSNADSSEAF
ncbi:gas vesicle protein [Nonomuraea sp. PA05]|uniref:gas vesicle protein n=1 Tax=Nonomuraea sp. PA05 TaxID=2604466 RepID=UPI0021CC6A13|nr:gas vesicle protein [Nonomuraea sp. PA05]